MRFTSMTAARSGPDPADDASAALAAGRRRSRARLLGTLGAAAAAATLLAPVAAHADALVPGSLPLTDTTETVGPGITLQHVKALGQGGWYDEQLLTVDLSQPAVSTNLLTSGPVASGGPLSAAVNSAGAVAGINGDFFDIGNSNAAQGGEVQSGQLIKSADSNLNANNNSFGVSSGGIAQLVNLAVTANATLNGTSYNVASVNAADSAGVPANSMVAYTSAWGTYSRARGFASAKSVAEVLVENGEVVSVSSTIGSGAIPADGFVLVGSGSDATAIKALTAGEPVTLTYGLNDDAAKAMQFAIGDGGTIVSNGQPVSGLDTSIAPRTAVGFKDDGHTLGLATWDGPGGTGHGGIGVDVEAADMVADGVQTAVNLDGGGSTTMVARALGDQSATVRNVPSDGSERSDPNGIGVFVAPGDGMPDHLAVDIAPNEQALDGTARVFAGMHRTLVAKGYDSNDAPVSLTGDNVNWSSSQGSVSNGVLTAPADPRGGQIDVTAQLGHVRASESVRVLGPLQDLELSSDRLSIADATPADATTISVTGRDNQGYTAPIDPQDLTLDYDHSVISVTPVNGQLEITPLTNAGTILTVSADGQSVQLPITIGVQTVTPYSFDDDVTSRWKNNSTAATTFTKTADGLQISFPAMRNVGITANGAANRVAIPGQPLRIRVKIKSTISVPSGLTYVNYVDGKGNSVGLYGTGLNADPNNWQYATFTLPANTNFPIAIQSFQGINTAVANQKAGTFVLGDIEADVPTTVDLPAEAPLTPDRLISDDGTLPSGNGDWTFGTISDIQFTADNPDLAQVATTAIHRIRQTHPDLIILNGDVTDRGLPQDLSLARQVLENAGCDLIPVGQEPPADSTPDPNGATIPCYYVPGNHESYGLNNVQLPDLTNFVNEFGQPYRYFDHKGTRFILLASSLGTLHGTDWAQLPMFQQALASAAKDPSIHNVMVFAHHPVDDPSSTKSSQLGDRDEVALIEQMLTQFRDSTGKGAAMIGSHAQVAYVHRIEGVPYVVLPSSGKDPYGTPDRGGFTGWVDWSIDPHANASQQWLTGDIHAFAQSITLNTPDSVPVGTTAQLSGSIVQPEGVSTGTRVVPLQYPMSVDWGGSSNLAIGSGQQAIDQARREGKTAILDPATRVLTGLREGTVTVSVTNDSMQPYTDDSSLAPIVAQKTIQIAPTVDGPGFTANTPVFENQLVGTVGFPQQVTVQNTGTQPLKLGRISITSSDGVSAADFRLSEPGCQDRMLQVNATCTVLVSYAPQRPSVTSQATLAFQTNTASKEQDVTLTATSLSRPTPVGPDGPPPSQGDGNDNGNGLGTGNLFANDSRSGR